MELDLDFELTRFNLYQIGLAFLLSLPIAFNREHRTRARVCALFSWSPSAAAPSCW
jgi:hypothetical protein